MQDNRHDASYLFGALCPDRVVRAAMIMPAANNEAIGYPSRDGTVG
jgi:hypothetical protein